MSNGRPEIVSVMHFTAEEARKMLGVCKETMYAYVKSGRIRRYRLSDRKYLYDRADVFLMSGVRPAAQGDRIVAYCRVASRTSATAPDMDGQVLRVTDWCMKQGMQVSETYRDVCSSLEFRKDRRPGFHAMLTGIMERRIDTVVMESPDRLARFGYEMFVEMCARYRVKVMFMLESPANVRYKDEVKDELRRVIEDIKNMYDNRATFVARDGQ